MAKQRQRAGASAGILAAIGMAAVAAVVAIVTGLGHGIGNAAIVPDAISITSSVSTGTQPG